MVNYGILHTVKCVFSCGIYDSLMVLKAGSATCRVGTAALMNTTVGQLVNEMSSSM